MKKVLKKSLVREGNTPPPRNQFDPVLSVYNPAKYLGATSEQFATAVGEYAKKNPSKLLLLKGEEDPIKRKKALVKVNNFKTLMNIKYMRSLVEPGEAVGLLASQGYARSLLVCAGFVLILRQCRRAVHADDAEHFPFRW